MNLLGIFSSKAFTIITNFIIPIIGGIIIPICIIKKQSNAKKIRYKCIHTNIFNCYQIKHKDISAAYNNSNYQKLDLLEIKFRYRGNQSLKPNEYQSDIIINTGINSKILSCEIVEQDLNLNFESKDNILTIQPFLINPQEIFTLKMLIANFDNCHNLKIQGRICDTKIVNVLEVTLFDAILDLMVSMCEIIYIALINLLLIFTCIYFALVNMKHNNILLSIEIILGIIFNSIIFFKWWKPRFNKAYDEYKYLRKKKSKSI